MLMVKWLNPYVKLFTAVMIFAAVLFLGFCSVMLLYPDGGVGLSRGRCRFIQRAVWIGLSSKKVWVDKIFAVVMKKNWRKQELQRTLFRLSFYPIIEDKQIKN